MSLNTRGKQVQFFVYYFACYFLAHVKWCSLMLLSCFFCKSGAFFLYIVESDCRELQQTFTFYVILWSITQKNGVHMFNSFVNHLLVCHIFKLKESLWKYFSPLKWDLEWKPNLKIEPRSMTIFCQVHFQHFWNAEFL